MRSFLRFKRKTAYEIYQCDWSSDVCSSDLGSDSRGVAKLSRRFFSAPQMSPKLCIAADCFSRLGNCRRNLSDSYQRTDIIFVSQLDSERINIDVVSSKHT